MQFPWLPSMNVGVPKLDVEHEHLFELLRELGNSIEQRNTSGAKVLADEYVTLLEGHFREEETLMRRSSYPDMDDHVAEHRQCLALLRGMRQAILTGRMGTASELLAEYTGRYFRDMLRDDNLFARYLQDGEAETLAPTLPRPV